VTYLTTVIHLLLPLLPLLVLTLLPVETVRQSSTLLSLRRLTEVRARHGGRRG